MSRVTAPLSSIARALSNSPASAAASSATPSSARIAGAALMPKYADLLRNRRSSEHSDSSRRLTTTHRPTPQPSIANRVKPLMQTFHSSAPLAAPTPTHIDATVFPSMISLADSSSEPDAGPRVPILPDNYAVAHGPLASEPTAGPQVTIVAANPDNVVPGAPKAGIESIGLDGVELKFLYDEGDQGQLARNDDDRSGGMIRDIWKGMLEDVLGGGGRAPKRAM